MNIFTEPEDVLIAALSAKQPTVKLRLYGPAGMRIEGTFRNALKKERRLLAFLQGYDGIYNRENRWISFANDCELELQYQDDAPDSLSDVILDNHDFDVSRLMTPNRPLEAVIVTDDQNRIKKAMESAMSHMQSCYEGLMGCEFHMARIEKLSKDCVVRISYLYIMPFQDLRVWQRKAAFNAKLIWKKLLGGARPAPFVKPFLAFSYLMQECEYDQFAYDEIVRDKRTAQTDPAPNLAYGPLEEKRGICGGIAWAFKRLMDEARIPCLCVTGYLRAKPTVGHMWNLVQLDGQYYHVDAAWGLDSDGVCVEKLLKPDSDFERTHIWEAGQYPKATGRRYQYDFIEDFLVEHGGGYLDEGADEKYMFPDSIIE